LAESPESPEPPKGLHLLKGASLARGRSGTISVGTLAVQMSIQPSSDPEFEGMDRYSDLEVSLTVNSKRVGGVRNTTAFTNSAFVQIVELDPSNAFPEVLFSMFDGGAHCCTTVTIFTQTSGSTKWKKVPGGVFDGGGEPAVSVLGKGRSHLITFDHAFLYRFGSYAGSFWPDAILELQGGKMVNVSHRGEFVAHHRKALAEMEKHFPTSRPGSNGFWAGYVAAKSLVNEFDDGWKRMLDSYDTESTEGLETCVEKDSKGNCRKHKKYSSFPEALGAFLKEKGYVSSL
jgi:hypothetical protein